MKKILETYCRDYSHLAQIAGEQNGCASVCFTGHRTLPAAELPALNHFLRLTLLEACELGFKTFYCGAALGFDLLAGFAVLDLRRDYPDMDIRLVLVVPCADQSRYWPAAEKARWEELKARADEVIVKSPDYYAGCMQVRNRHMVDQSQLCICYQSSFSGGTFSTVRYAQRKGIPVLNLCIVLMKESVPPAESTPVLREADLHGAVCPYPILRPEVPVLRLLLFSRRLREPGRICRTPSFRSIPARRSAFRRSPVR